MIQSIWGKKMKFVRLFIVLLSMHVIVCRSSQENSVEIGSKMPLSAESFFPLSPMHRTITLCMQLYGFLSNNVTEFSRADAQTYEKKMSELQNSVEDLILENNYIIHDDDIAYVSQLIRRILLAAQEKNDSFAHALFIAQLQDVQTTVDQLVR